MIYTTIPDQMEDSRDLNVDEQATTHHLTSLVSTVSGLKTPDWAFCRRMLVFINLQMIVLAAFGSTNSLSLLYSILLSVQFSQALVHIIT